MSRLLAGFKVEGHYDSAYAATIWSICLTSSSAIAEHKRVGKSLKKKSLV